MLKKSNESLIKLEDLTNKNDIMIKNINEYITNNIKQ